MRPVARPGSSLLGGTQVARDRPAGPAAPGDATRNAPVIVLAPPYGGASPLGSLLARHPDLACTAGTGLLPLCEQAMATWRRTDGRAGGPPSALATASTRALAASIIGSLLARAGKQRWCEVATANSAAAETFLDLYRGTRFVCLHRACAAVIRTALNASPWGIADPALAPFTRAYPASTVAALAACWVIHTEALLTFEQAYPQACLRVRFEDLTGAQHETTQKVTTFLGLTSIDGQTMPGEGSQPQPAPESPGHETDIPAGLIPPGILEQANDLLRQLSYPALATPTAG